MSLLQSRLVKHMRVPIFALDDSLSSGEYPIADHVNLTGSPIKDLGFIPVTDLYSHKSDSTAIQVACIKHGTEPSGREAEYLVSQDIKAYCYDLIEPALYAACTGSKISAFGYIPKLPIGFKAFSTCAGLKETGKNDLGILLSDFPCIWAAAFTENKARAYCVEKNQELFLSQKPVRAIICNAGNANACTGIQGEQSDLSVRKALAGKFNLNADEVLMASTGKIGVILPDDKINNAIKNLDTSKNQSIKGFAESILTTDLSLKISQDANALILGFTKGSGMIAPKMSVPKSATMLAFLVSDVKLAGFENDIMAMQKKLRELLAQSVSKSFNAISVDGDTSTNDMVLLLSNMQGKLVSVTEFKSALDEACMSLAEKIILDGEGTTKIIDLNIHGLKDELLARNLGMVIINSPLVKTAIHGCDPNWGRIIAALGNAANEFGVDIDFSTVSLDLLWVRVFEQGMPANFDKAELTTKMKRNKFIKLDLSLGYDSGSKPVRVLGSDLSYEYVRINAEYFT